MKTTLGEMIKKLEEQGIDTSNFSINIDGKDLSEFLELAKANVEKGTCNHKTFRRWVFAQTWRMLTEPVWVSNYEKKTGWEYYMKHSISFDYQLKMLEDELKVLEKMSKNPNSEEFKYRQKFFTLAIVYKTCVYAYEEATKNIKKYCGMSEYFVKSLSHGKSILLCMLDLPTTHVSSTYRAWLTALRDFRKCYAIRYVDSKTRKCQEWKDAYKASGAFYSLENMILHHDCVLPGCKNGKDSYNKLKSLTDMFERNGELWRLHQIMLDTIQYNDFDLVKSIRLHK